MNLRFLIVLITIGTVTAVAETIRFPEQTNYTSVTAYGANGADNLDDTQAFKDAIAGNWTFCGGHAGNFRTLYVPKGTYIVSDEIFWLRWLRLVGESREETIIRLLDNAPGYQDPSKPKPVLRCRFTGNSCSPWDGAENSSFGNNIINLTVSVGRGNPGAIGIRYNNHNDGALRDVTIRSEDGAGAIGLDMTETEFGPALIRNVTIEGFDKGIETVGSVSHATFENITLKNQNVVGILNHLPVSIHRLISVNKVPVIRNQDFHMAHVVLIDADLSGGAGDVSAIENFRNIYLRNIRTSGYSSALKGESGMSITEYFSGEPVNVFDSPKRHLNLPIEMPQEPETVTDWVYIHDSEGDDTKTIQDEFNSGKANFIFKFQGNYTITTTVTIPASVKRINGMNWGVGANPDHFIDGKPLFRIMGGTDEQLMLDFFTIGTYPKFDRTLVEVASSRPVYWRSGRNGGFLKTTAGATGPVFLEDTHVGIEINGPARVYARHYNMENNPYSVDRPVVTYAVNNGGSLWILGYKTEAIAVHAVTTGRGSTEILGGFFRDHVRSDDVPFFRTTDASFSATYFNYAWGSGHTRELHAVETRGGQTKNLTMSRDSRAVHLYSGYAADAASSGPLPNQRMGHVRSITRQSATRFFTLDGKVTKRAGHTQISSAAGVVLEIRASGGERLVRMLAPGANPAVQ